MKSNNNDDKKSLNNKIFRKKLLISIVWAIISTVVLTSILVIVQNEISQGNQEKESNKALDSVVELLEANDENIVSLTESFHTANKQMLEDVYQAGIADTSASTYTNKFRNLFERTEENSPINLLFLVNNNGVVLASTMDTYGVITTNNNLVDIGLVSRNDLKRMLDQRNSEVVHTSSAEGDHYYYTKYVDKDCYLILKMDDVVLDYQSHSLSDISNALQTSMLGESGFLFAINTKTHKFVYYENDDDNLTGKNVSDYGISDKIYKDNYSGLQTIGDDVYYCVSRTYNKDTVICAAINVIDIYFGNNDIVRWIKHFYIIMLILVVLYSIILKNYFRGAKTKSQKKEVNLPFVGKRYLDVTLGKRMVSFVLVSTILVFFVSYYSSSLLSAEQAMKESESTVETIDVQLSNTSETRSYVEEYYVNHYLTKAEYIAYLLEEDVSFLNEYSTKYHTYYDEENNRYTVFDNEYNDLKSIQYSTYLQNLCDNNQFTSIYVFDDFGHTIATNTGYWYFTISHNEEDQSYDFLQVLDGKRDQFIQAPRIDDQGEMNQYIGVSFDYYTTTDEYGNTVYVSKCDYQQNPENVHEHHSMIQIGLNPFTMNDVLYSTDTTYTLSNTLIPYNGYLTTFSNDEDHTITYSSQSHTIGQKAKDIGLSEAAFTGKYTGFKSINGLDYLVTIREISDGYMAINLLTSQVYKGRIRLSVIASIISLIFLAIAALSICMSSEEDDSYLYALILENKMKASSTPFISKSELIKKWDALTPQQKLILIVKVICFAFSIFIFIRLSNVGGIWDNSIESYIISGYWDHNFNIFSLSNCALILFSTFIWVNVINQAIHLASKAFTTKTETLAHLLMSLFKYGGTLTAIFYCLYLVGFDSASLLTSAGILSLVVGLGAQSMIADILAGISIVFEGSFQVGDVVKIDGQRGQVLDIGLRTTRIKSEENNIIVFNNSKISGLTNMTRELSVIKTIVKVRHGISLFTAESILKEELPYVKTLVPLIKTGPTYKGVDSIESNFVCLAIVTYCRERDIVQVERDLNRQIYLILKQHGIIVNDEDIVISKYEV